MRTNDVTAKPGRRSRSEGERGLLALLAGSSIWLSALLLVGCGGEDPLSLPGSVEIASVTVEPDEATIRAGSSVEFSTTVLDVSGQVRTDVEIAWSTNPSTVASIDGNGVATSETPGSTLVVAEVDGVQGSAQLTVEPAVEGVTVTPSTLNIAVGETAPLSADVDGDPENSVSWSSDNTAVATVDTEGNVTGVAEGSAAVTATSTLDETESASATVNVTGVEQ